MRTWLIGCRGEAVGRREAVEQPVARSVQPDFLAQMPEDLKIDLLDFEAALVFDASARTKDRGSFAAEVRMKEQAGLGERGLGARQDLRQADRARTEDDGMAPIDDPEVRLPPKLLNAPELPRREPVGMERAIEHLERQVGDSRSPGANTHAQHVLSGLWPLLSDARDGNPWSRLSLTRWRPIIRTESIAR